MGTCLQHGYLSSIHHPSNLKSAHITEVRGGYGYVRNDMIPFIRIILCVMGWLAGMLMIHHIYLHFVGNLVICNIHALQNNILIAETVWHGSDSLSTSCSFWMRFTHVSQKIGHQVYENLAILDFKLSVLNAQVFCYQFAVKLASDLHEQNCQLTTRLSR